MRRCTTTEKMVNISFSIGFYFCLNLNEIEKTSRRLAMFASEGRNVFFQSQRLSQLW